MALFGYGAHATAIGGWGSGSVNNRQNISIKDGLEDANINIVDNSWLLSSKEKYEKALGDQNPHVFRYADPEVSQKDIDENKADVSIYVLTRLSGEGSDRTNTSGDYQLTSSESLTR